MGMAIQGVGLQTERFCPEFRTRTRRISDQVSMKGASKSGIFHSRTPVCAAARMRPSLIFHSMFEFLEFDPLNASVYAKQHV